MSPLLLPRPSQLTSDVHGLVFGEEEVEDLSGLDQQVGLRVLDRPVPPGTLQEEGGGERGGGGV